jgi:hypothetical protein
MEKNEIKTKKCSTCLITKELTEFHKLKNDYRSRCKACRKIESSNYIANNEEMLKEKSKKYYQNKKDLLLEKSNSYYKNNKNKVATRNKKYRAENKDIIKKRKAKYEREKNKRDPLYQLKTNLRSMICSTFKNKGYKKTTKTHFIIGCNFDEFKQYLESQFESWMNWDNKGLYNGTENYGWDIDHIIPLKTAITEEDVIRLNHYTNLRPLCSYYNRDIKCAKLII